MSPSDIATINRILQKSLMTLTRIRAKLPNGDVASLKTKEKIEELSSKAVIQAIMKDCVYTRMKGKRILKHVRLNGAAAKSVYMLIIQQKRVTRTIKTIPYPINSAKQVLS